MPRLGVVAALLTGAILAAACSVVPEPDDGALVKAQGEDSPSSALPFEDPSTPVGPLAEPEWRVGVDALSEDADAAFLGYLDAVGTVNDDGSWELVLESERLADRAAYGALQLSIAFSRHHDDPGALTGPTAPEAERRQIGLAPESPLAATRSRLEAVAEVGGTQQGTLVRTLDGGAVMRVIRLAERLGLAPRTTVDGGALVVTLPEMADQATVAGWSYVCPRRVPGTGAPDCPEPLLSLSTEAFDELDPDRWLTATTGPLADAARNEPPTESGGVSWTNREAQVYRPEQVIERDGALWIEARPNALPSIDATPFVSGMVISRHRIGWGRVEVDVVVPQGAGLWPAVWLLPVAACEAPGRCPGYRTRRYVEVDLLETIGHEPGRLHTSVHWFEGQLRSVSEVHDFPIDDGAVHTVWMEWRPGIIIHGVGDRSLVSFPTTLEPGSPLSTAPDHRLVLNLAVGGTFSGDGLIGRGGGWWGDASPPPGWPSIGWDRAAFLVHEVRYQPLN